MSAAVEARDLVKTYRKSGRGIHGLDLEVPEGTVFGLLGPNGAGKTTFVKCLLGLLAPNTGSLEIFGSPVNRAGARVGVGFVPESPRFGDYLSAEEVMRIHARLIGIPSSEINSATSERLEAADLADAPKRVKSYSKGMVRRLALAQGLLGDPRMLILDEPAADLDPIGRRAVRNQIVEARERGATVILNSHLLSEVERSCDHVAIIHKGRLLATGTMPELVPEGKDLETVFVDLIEAQS
ncbi:MAG: ABC transporter ATP-binding protein [Actinobacteria bacterium]|nr:ABC transporter ATP-binding protein [Actinomycetota bacterium]